MFRYNGFLSATSNEQELKTDSREQTCFNNGNLCELTTRAHLLTQDIKVTLEGILEDMHEDQCLNNKSPGTKIEQISDELDFIQGTPVNSQTANGIVKNSGYDEKPLMNKDSSTITEER